MNPGVYPDPGIAFHRLSEQESFDPDMTPHGSIVCCEIMSSVHRPMAKKSDMELMELALKGLTVMGYHGFDILHKRVIRLPQSYPVFATGYRPKLVALMDRLDQFVNFRSIRQQGAYSYIGTLDAMDIGYGLSAGYQLANCLTGEWNVSEQATTLFWIENETYFYFASTCTEKGDFLGSGIPYWPLELITLPLMHVRLGISSTLLISLVRTLSRISQMQVTIISKGNR